MNVLFWTQGIVKAMGCGLLAPLVNEVAKKEKSLDQWQAAITCLTKVHTHNSSTFMFR